MVKIENIQWASVYQSINEKGYAILPKFFTTEQCTHFIEQYKDEALYRSTIDMARYRFGNGQYKYFSYPLPITIQRIREGFYPPLAILANEWMVKLGAGIVFPSSHSELIQQCSDENQRRPTPLILQYKKDGYNTLHQDLYGKVYFPFQVVVPLSDQGNDFEGGEFILTEQVPRAQSRAEVVPLNKGDALIFTTNFRPVKGSKGFYKVKVKHGVSTLRYGERYALGIIFHDAS
jgi:hypothetical protein